MKLLEALRCQNRGRPPIWMMRQAGRYMASYRALRARYSMLELCTNSELIVETTLLPLQEFGFDAAIIFSDIALIAKAMGLGLEFIEGVGPVVQPWVHGAEQLQQWRQEELDCVLEAIRELKRVLTVPLIGFAAAPWTLASYLVEGKAAAAKQWWWRDQEGFERLLDLLLERTVTYLQAQVAAGADCVQLFDSWAHELPGGVYARYVERWVRPIVERVACPVVLFARGSCMPLVSAAAISVDWQCHLPRLREQVGPTVALQGNIDPGLLLADRATVVREVRHLLASMAGDPGWICNLGHGVLPATPEDNVRAVVECVHAAA